MGNSKRISVLQVIHSLHIGGAEKVVVDLATKLDSKRFDTVVCCLNEKGILAEELEAAGINIVVPEKSKRHRYLNSLALRHTIQELSPDIVHTHGTPALLHAFPAYMLGKLPPMVHTFHFGNYPNVPKKYLYAERIGIRFAKRLVAVSYHQRDAVMRALYVRPKSIKTILNGVAKIPVPNNTGYREAVRKKLGVGKNDILIGCVAVLTIQKGITYLLDAVRQVSDKSKDIRIVIIGGGPLQENLETEADNKGVSEVVSFLGWRNDADELMAAFDIYVAPSLWEGLSISLLEAMSAGLPIVATDVGDNSKVIKNGLSGLLVPPGDADALGDALQEMINKRDEAKRMGEAASSYYMSHLTVDHMVENYDHLYTDMLLNSK